MASMTQTETAPALQADVLGPPDAAPLATRPVVKAGAPAAPAQIDASALSYRHSEAIGALAMALAMAQGQFQEIDKSLTAKVESRREGARGYTYKYVDLATVLQAVRPSLSQNGLAIMQIPTVRRGAVIVTTMLVHGASGEWFQADIAVALDNLDPQAVGSATTYARRYGLTALLSIAAGEADDDGVAAQRAAQLPTEAPSGFDAWWLDMEACADTGIEALDKAWQASRGEFKNHVSRHMRDQWNALKAKASAVKS